VRGIRQDYESAILNVDAASGAAAVLAVRHSMERVRHLGTARSRVPIQRDGEPAVTRGIIVVGRERRGDIMLLTGIRCAIEPRELVLELDPELAKLRAREVLICVHGWILLLLDGRILDARMQTAPPRDGARVGRGKSDGQRRMRGR